MARAVFVKKARKDNSAVKAGESYWWWSFRFGGKYYSKTRPRPSQLTQSDFMSQILELGEEIDDLSVTITTIETLVDIRDDIADRIQVLGEEQSDKFENMPEGFQEGPTGELLENRYEESVSMADQLEAVDLEDFDEDEMKLEEWLAEKIEELQAISYEGE